MILLLNHLWQSTLVVVAVALLAWLLRKNRAQVRYWLWLATSVKFLIPFALLVALGSRFEWRSASAPVTPVAVSMAVEQFSQPFTPLSMDSTAVGFVHSNSANPLPSILLALWFVGFAAILCRWYLDWRRVRALARAALPLPLDLGVPVLSSPGSMEPGIFGIFRPVLLLPEGINEKLAPDQLKAVLAHELCHVRRRDNLAAAIHKLVEVVFWFHPLVWWIGARLVEERERACDEEVLRTGSEPEVYAESILKTCQFYLESPSACMSGVTGGELKERIVRIMTHRGVHRLGIGRKLLLAAVSIAAVAGPIAFGLMSAPQETTKAGSPRFEVASIKPAKPGSRGSVAHMRPGGRLIANNVPLELLLEETYHVTKSQIVGAPPWVASDRFDIIAKPDDTAGAAIDKLPPEQHMVRMTEMIQSLMADRFKLVLRREIKELPVYALVVAKNGPKFHQSVYKSHANSTDETIRKKLPQGVFFTGPGRLTVSDGDIPAFATALSRSLDRNVVNKTELKGRYDFTLIWTPDEHTPSPFGPGSMGKYAPPPPDPNGPSLFTAVQEQLGLKLESQKGPVEILVIDHVEKPTAN